MRNSRHTIHSWRWTVLITGKEILARTSCQFPSAVPPHMASIVTTHSFIRIALSLSLSLSLSHEMALRFQSTPIQTSTGFAPSISRYASSKFNFLRFARSPNFSQISEMGKGSSVCQAIQTTDLQNVIAAHSSQPGQLVIISRDLHRHETDIGYLSYALSEHLSKLVLADLDPSTAKLAIGLLGPLLSGFGFLFILRIIMSWYPKLPVGKFPYVIAYAPTEPLLSPTRKLIQPVGGVDVTPVVWFAIISFLNEILVGPQGLLVLLSQKV